jgi:peptidoglycan/LPS O-acetylase OafA/YrhL
VPYLVLHGGLLLPLFSVMVFGLSGRHAISRIFAWGPLLLVGESSYVLYLLHFNAFILMHKYHLVERLHLAALDPWISYAILIALSVVVYKYFENPVRKAILNRFPPGSRRASAS